MYVPRELVEKRLWSNLDKFLEYIGLKSVPVVVGSYWPLPLILDRPLAELLSYKLAEKGFWAIVLTDELLYRMVGSIASPPVLLKRAEEKQAAGEDRPLLDILVEYEAPIIAIGSCFANRLVCDVAGEGSPRRNPYGDERVAEVSVWRDTEVFMVYGREPEETRDLLLKSIPEILEWLEEKYGDRKIELVKHVDLGGFLAPVYGGPWIPDDVERLFEEYRVGAGQVDLRLLVAERAVLIVVPTWVESELWERRWAYKLVQRLREHGLWGVVVTDKYLLDESRDSHGRILLDLVKRKRTPVISIGGPVSNMFTRMIEENTLRSPEKYGDLWLTRGNIALVVWEGIPVALVWGATLQDTIKRLEVFTARYLEDFINQIKTVRARKEETETSLKNLLNELTPS